MKSELENYRRAYRFVNRLMARMVVKNTAWYGSPGWSKLNRVKRYLNRRQVEIITDNG